MLILKLAYHKAIVPDAMLPLLPMITPIKTVGKAMVKDEECELSIEVCNETLVTEPAKIEAAQQEEYKSSRDLYQRLYEEQSKLRQQLEAKVKELTPSS